jgi:hypothetical protein
VLSVIQWKQPWTKGARGKIMLQPYG